MRGLLTPEYDDVFDDVAQLSEILSSVSSIESVKILCYLNASFEGTIPEVTRDREFVLLMIRGFSTLEQNRILWRLSSVMDTHRTSRVFHSLYLTYFLHYELHNYRTNASFEYEELRDNPMVFRAYLRIVSMYHQRNSKIANEASGATPEELFQRRVWPTLFLQHEFNRNVEVSFELFKAYILLDWLKQQPKYQLFVESYCKLQGCSNVVEVVGVYAALFRSIRTHKSAKYSKSWISAQIAQRPLLDSLCHPMTHSPDTAWEPGHLTSIKAKPLFKDSQDNYHVLNRSFLYRNTYEGLLRDFCSRSGISNDPNYFATLKSVIGKPVVEKRIFRAFLKEAYRNRLEEPSYDDEQDQGLPDAWVREGRYAIILECKDAEIPERLLVDLKRDELLAELRKKHVRTADGQSKTIEQLAKSAEAITRGRYPKEFYGEYSPKDVWILPVLVVSGYNYSAPGINEFLNAEFRAASAVRTGPLTVITMEYLFRLVVDIEKTGLSRLLFSYHNELRKRRKAFQSNPDGWHALDMNASIEEVIGQRHPPSKVKRRQFVKNLFAQAGLPGN